MTDLTQSLNINEVAVLIRRMAKDVKVADTDLVLASNYLLSKIDAPSAVDQLVILDQSAKIQTSSEHNLYVS